jgi:hypothetical protein
MRDGSIKDMADLWVARIIENTNWAPSSAIHLAIIRHSAEKYLTENMYPQSYGGSAAELEALLHEILSALPKSDSEEEAAAVHESWFPPSAIAWSQIKPELMQQRYAYYWTTDMWKGDFLTALESQFWTYRDYAHGAKQGKMAFLRQLAEVWIAAATTALVRYADNDKRTWRATAKMLRRHADMVEADGLRALPWGRWGQYSPHEAQVKAAAEYNDD